VGGSLGCSAATDPQLKQKPEEEEEEEEDEELQLAADPDDEVFKPDTTNQAHLSRFDQVQPQQILYPTLFMTDYNNNIDQNN